MSNKHIFNLVSTITKPVFKDKGEYFIKLIESWSSLAPKAWQGAAIPNQLKWDNNNQATLILNINSPSLALLFSYESNLVINKINAYLGHKVIVKIKFITV